MKGTYVERDRKKERKPKPKPETSGAKKGVAAMVPAGMAVSRYLSQTEIKSSIKFWLISLNLFYTFYNWI